MAVQRTGVRSSSPNDSHSWVKSDGWMEWTWGTESSTALSTANPTVAAMAPTGTSVRVDTNSPIAASPIKEKPTTNEAPKVRTMPSASDTVVPDRVTTSPIGNSTTPASSPPNATTRADTRQKTPTVAALTNSSRVRPDGRVNR